MHRLDGTCTPKLTSRYKKLHASQTLSENKLSLENLVVNTQKSLCIGHSVNSEMLIILSPMLWCRGIYTCLLCTTKHATHYRLYIPDSWGASHGPCLQTPKNFAELLSQEAPKHQHPRYNAPQFNKICQCHMQVLQLQICLVCSQSFWHIFSV